MPQPQPHLLRLPAELIQIILNHLPLEGTAALALTCHQLYNAIGTFIFQEFTQFPPSFKHRTAKSFFLRGLQKDRADPSLYVCYACLRFHKICDSSLVHVTGHCNQVGFPFCHSTYVQAMNEVKRRLHIPRSEQIQPASIWSGEITSPVHMEYSVTIGIGPRDLFLLRKYSLKAKEGRYKRYFMVPSYYLRTANLEICRHAYFGYDYVKGDGSINDALHWYYKKQHQEYCEAVASGQVWHPKPFEGFVCGECKLEVEIRFVGMDITVLVWQHMGGLSIGLAGRVKSRMLHPLSNKHASFAKRIAGREVKAGDLKEEWKRFAHVERDIEPRSPGVD